MTPGLFISERRKFLYSEFPTGLAKVFKLNKLSTQVETPPPLPPLQAKHLPKQIQSPFKPSCGLRVLSAALHRAGLLSGLAATGRSAAFSWPEASEGRRFLASRSLVISWDSSRMDMKRKFCLSSGLNIPNSEASESARATCFGVAR